jgi:AraC family ethanolamine operon transcriptional activator
MPQLTSSHFSSFDAYAAAIQHANARMTLVGREQGNWALSYLPVSEMSIQWGSGGAAACEGGTVRGGLTVFLPIYESEGTSGNEQRLLGNGHRLESGSVLIMEPGADFCITATGVHRWSSIFVPHDLLTSSDIPGTKNGTSHRVLLPSEAGEHLKSIIDLLGAILRDKPDALASTRALQSAKSKVSEAIGKALSHNDANTPSGRPSLPRALIVQRVLSAIEKHCDEHLSVYRLSNMVGVSERTLRTAFEEYFGVGPTKYLKIRTLHEARKLLRAADPFATSVTDIAVGLGIWEFGRFSHDYKMLFGELPSATLRK